MSGLEPLAIAGQAAKAVVKAEQGDPQDREALRELAKESGALDPAARAYAKRLAVKEQIRMKIWQPLGMLFGISRDYFENDFADDLADRVAQIPEEELITPRLSVAGPTVQGIAFTVDEPELRAMYLNLLAAASDSRVASTAHPAFAEIIRQLSPEEAVILGPVLNQAYHPIIEIRSKVVNAEGGPDRGWNTLSTLVMNWTLNGQQAFVPERALQIVNWQRLGLVTVAFDTFMTADGAYEWAETNPRVIGLRTALDTDDLKRIQIEKGLLTVTDFGRAFNQVVIRPGRAAQQNQSPTAADDSSA
ncbi:DUF4393 domain-containing protein [Segeticoccus rhizosphaerae]|uniref:DUF4393 domain-containing protein n=1 Tax=Segeticoccus rhizosphaerae TaxID=1104777 RepID=UPI001396B9AF|nr:DUF4393 domain-containing protein [Segeticoccus rhizosphaerae]